MSAFGQDSARRDRVKDTVVHKVDSLKPATVVAPLRPHLHGDTVEYNTERIRLRVNGNIEELLSRLPGLQIDPDGNITYNGEKIQRLLVDGEDIFGDNPSLVTRNFDASKIAKVQVLDRKSDKALFSGVDEGSRTKTLNLVLKESARDGYFGKVEAGDDKDGHYDSKGVLAAFKDKAQYTAIGLANNVGAIGFSSNAGGGSASVSLVGGAGDPLNASAGAGIPHFAGAALHFANSWNGTIDHVAGNYQCTHYFTHPETFTRTLQAEPGTSYTQLQQSQSVNQQDQHWALATFDWTPPNAGTFKFMPHASAITMKNQYSASGKSSFGDTLVNSSQRAIHDNLTQLDIGGDVSWKIAIRRPERVFSVNISIAPVDNATNGFLFSLNGFYQPNGSLQRQDTIDQRKQIVASGVTTNATLNYTEPFWKGTTLGMSYTITAVTDNSLLATYDRGDGKYQQVVDSLTSHRLIHAFSQLGLINLKGKITSLEYTAGLFLQSYTGRQKDLLADTTLRQQYLTWSPQLLVTFKINSSANVKFSYSASNTLPSFDQLQPIRNNNDPLHITVGNPNLRPGSSQQFRLVYNRLKIWVVNLSLAVSLVTNSISTKTITDSLGRQISQPLNLNGGQSATFNYSLNRKLLGLDVGFRGNAKYLLDVNYVNDALSRNSTFSGSAGFTIGKLIPDKFAFRVYSNFGYSSRQSSISTTAPVRFWTQAQVASFTLFFLHPFEINTNGTYSWQQRTTAFPDNTAVVLWNGYISRNFLHDHLVVKFQYNNILNQNSGINRSNVNNITTQTTSNILGRYWMLSAVYHFDKKFKRK